MTPEPDSPPAVIDIDPRNFETVVLAGSNERPVLVDFWATWCEPCKTLGPKLEAAAKESGAFTLAKVDIDRFPELAQAFGVQGIPAVFALSGGKVVDGFQGALPDDELDAFLARVVPGGVGAGPIEEARKAAEAGDLEGAIRMVKSLVTDPTHGVPAYALLAELLTDAGRYDEAREAFEALELLELPEDVAMAVARAKRALESREEVGDLDELIRTAKAKPDDAGAQLEAGRALVAVKRYAEGLELLLESVRIDPTLESGAAKQAMLDTFDVLGLEDETANEYRFQLSLEILA